MKLEGQLKNTRKDLRNSRLRFDAWGGLPDTGPSIIRVDRIHHYMSVAKTA